MGNDEYNLTDFAKELDSLSSTVGSSNALNIISAIFAVNKYYNDNQILEDETSLNLKQYYIETGLYIHLCLRTFVEKAAESNAKIMDVIPFNLTDYKKIPDCELTTPVPLENFIIFQKKILSLNYQPSKDIASLVNDIHCLCFAYTCLGSGVCIPSSHIHKFNIAALKLLFFLGQFQAQLFDYPRKVIHRVNTKAGKENQKSKTKDKILEAYRVLGAEWREDEPRKRPILSRGLRISINNLAGTIFMHLKGYVTQRHINTTLQELRTKGEI